MLISADENVSNNVYGTFGTYLGVPRVPQIQTPVSYQKLRVHAIGVSPKKTRFYFFN